MKKIITLILSLILAFSVGFTACKGNKNVSSSSSSIIQSEEGSSTSSTVSKEESVSSAESESATNSSISSSSSSSTSGESQEPTGEGYTRVDAEGNESKTGSYVYFGSYPQSDVTSSMGETLASNVSTKPPSSNANGWTSYKYYISSSNSTDFMWYKDVEYSGSKYRAVYFTSYRPYYTENSSSTSNTYQYDNGYYTSNVYWFKYEPIKWRILEESNGKATLLAEMILDSQEYHDNYSTRTINEETIYANNYEYSSIRKWLNDNFYNTAFNATEKALIREVEVDNSARSTSPDTTLWNSGTNNYACNNTNDKVWLLSEQEVTRSSYGFATDASTYDTVRRKKTTAYSRCQGCWTSTSSSYAGNGRWWLRSPYVNDDRYARLVSGYGSSVNGNLVSRTNLGVVPALQISL